MKRFKNILIVILFLPLLFACGSEASNNQPPTNVASEVMMATTTSMNDSGVLDILAPAFKEDTGIDLKWTSQGSGAAMETAREGEAQLLFAHSPSAEEQLVDDGVSMGRHIIMFNNFLFVGPEQLPQESLEAAVQAICDGTGLPYVTRNDNSGTFNAEVPIFEEYCGKSSVDLPNVIDTGSGMLATLQIANEESRYTLTDLATWLQNMANFPNLKEAYYNKANMLNVYSIHQIKNAHFTEEQNNAAAEFVKWITEGRGQEIIKEYGVEQFGQPMFTLGDGTN
jgi:tungstate transport system substrate-binding protein